MNKTNFILWIIILILLAVGLVLLYALQDGYTQKHFGALFLGLGIGGLLLLEIAGTLFYTRHATKELRMYAVLGLSGLLLLVITIALLLL